MNDLDSVSRQLAGFRVSDEAREQLVSVRCPGRVSSVNTACMRMLIIQIGHSREVQGFVRGT
jgi:hypothetical protein